MKYKGKLQNAQILGQQQTSILGGNLSRKPHIFGGNFFQIIEVV